MRLTSQVWFTVGPLDPGSWQVVRDEEDLSDFMQFLWHGSWRLDWIATPTKWFSVKTEVIDG